jgi:hypothetical protein
MSQFFLSNRVGGIFMPEFSDIEYNDIKEAYLKVLQFSYNYVLLTLYSQAESRVTQRIDSVHALRGTLLACQI